jgi:hypothetical protein
MGESTIEFTAAVYKVQTLVDGGLRVTLDLPETAIAAAAMLMECQRQAVALRVSADPDNRNDAGGRTRRTRAISKGS